MGCVAYTNNPSSHMDEEEREAKSEEMVTEEEPIKESDGELTGKVADKCSVCLGPITDPTSLESCEHCFCYNCIRRWLLHCEINSCPLCKKPITSLLKKSGDEGKKKITMNELENELSCERRAARCNAVPLLSERALLTKRLHELRVYTGRLETFGPKSVDEYREKISELTALRLLIQSIDDRSISRSELTSNLRFRVAVYSNDSPAYIVDSNDNPSRRNFTVTICREDMERNRERVVPFIANELLALHEGLKREMRIMIQTTDGRYSVAHNIFELCGIHQIMSPPFKAALIRMGISPFVSERFQHELFEFASSGLDCDEYWKVVGYRLRGTPVSASRHSAIDGAPLPNIPVVVLDDGQENADDEDDVLIIEDQHQRNGTQTSNLPFSARVQVEDVYGHRWDADPLGFMHYPFHRLRPRFNRPVDFNRTTVVLSSDDESDENSGLDDRMDTSEESDRRTNRLNDDVLNVTNSTFASDSSDRKRRKKSSKKLQRSSIKRINRSIRQKDFTKLREWSTFLRDSLQTIDSFFAKEKGSSRRSRRDT